MLYSTQKSFKSSLPKHPQKVTTKNQELVKDRFIKTGEFIDPIQASKNSQSSQHANLYSPDDPTNALYRFELLKKFFMTKLDYIQVYETSNCLPDWCQFGKRYNMDIEDSSSYIFTPINIVNIFTRTSLKEKYCKHLARYSMLKFIIGEEPDYSFWKESKYVREA
jgi:hypothetical protein